MRRCRELQAMALSVAASIGVVAHRPEPDPVSTNAEPEFPPHYPSPPTRANIQDAMTDRDRERIAAAQAKRERRANKRLQIQEHES